jgi:hypothetical protein
MTTWPQISLNTTEGYSQYFGCGQDNPIGLKLRFQSDSEGVRTEFTPGGQNQGWPRYLHGGITARILDKPTSHATGVQTRVNCITARLQTGFTCLIPINQPLVITTSIVKKTRKVIQSTAVICLKEGTIAAEGNTIFCGQ